MPGRTKSPDRSRFGFNGKELDREWEIQDYGMRMYDNRLGKFLSTDPLAPDYPWYTPYQFAGNTPIWAIDIDGLEPGNGLRLLEDAAKKGNQKAQLELHEHQEMGKKLIVLPIAVGVIGGGVVAAEAGYGIYTWAMLNPMTFRATLGGVSSFTVGIFDEGGVVQLPTPIDDYGRATTRAVRTMKDRVSKAFREGIDLGNNHIILGRTSPELPGGKLTMGFNPFKKLKDKLAQGKKEEVIKILDNQLDELNEQLIEDDLYLDKLKDAYGNKVDFIEEARNNLNIDNVSDVYDFDEDLELYRVLKKEIDKRMDKTTDDIFKINDFKDKNDLD